jgi:3-oxoacyl-ACP reductase-like protein
MGLFSNLMSKIFGGSAGATQTSSASARSPATAPSAAPAASAASAPAATATTTTAPPPTVVDVTSILDGLAAKNPEKLDWRRSIVDLMKLVGMDSSLSARKELAKELNYQGDTGDSAAMNVWLHKEVIVRIAANGGKVPAELLD